MGARWRELGRIAAWERWAAAWMYLIVTGRGRPLRLLPRLWRRSFWRGRISNAVRSSVRLRATKPSALAHGQQPDDALFGLDYAAFPGVEMDPKRLREPADHIVNRVSPFFGLALVSSSLTRLLSRTKTSSGSPMEFSDTCLFPFLRVTELALFSIPAYPAGDGSAYCCGFFESARRKALGKLAGRLTVQPLGQIEQRPVGVARG